MIYGQQQNNQSTMPVMQYYVLGCISCGTEFTIPANANADSLIQSGWVTDGKNWSCPHCTGVNNQWHGGCCD